ncbi:MAG: hypothetical protein GWP91_20440 [Rhodobacterales bacterium]|nr:hypothetical protein [Rhodobacterales bacterium]
MMLDRTAARDLLESALREGLADDLIVRVSGGHRTHLRYARNQVNTCGIDTDDVFSVTASFGNRSGTASGNQLDFPSLIKVIRSAEALAKVSPEDPEHLPSLDRKTYLCPPSYKPAKQIDALQTGVAYCLTEAQSRGLIAAGYAEYVERYKSFASKNGGFAYYRYTDAVVSQTSRTPDGKGSGWAAETAINPDNLDFERLSAIACEKADATVNPKEIAPGPYETVFEPSAVANLSRLFVGGLDQRRTDEGRSFLSLPNGESRFGEKMFPDWMTVISHPGSPMAPAASYTGDGLPTQPREWITEGALKTLPCDRYWAHKHHRGVRPSPVNWLMDAPPGSAADLVKRVERGVLVTSLWYIRSVDPRTLTHTGLTRDGLFWIEDGKISHPLKNMRWNDSPVRIFADAIDVAGTIRAFPRGGGTGHFAVPALRTAGFKLTSVSDAV